jgi:hypothetical protein
MVLAVAKQFISKSFNCGDVPLKKSQNGVI